MTDPRVYDGWLLRASLPSAVCPTTGFCRLPCSKQCNATTGSRHRVVNRVVNTYLYVTQSVAVAWFLCVLAAVPLFAIGLSAGASIGLQLVGAAEQTLPIQLTD